LRKKEFKEFKELQEEEPGGERREGAALARISRPDGF
jgi:hypothetical protein